jgi:hypothetical protein
MQEKGDFSEFRDDQKDIESLYGELGKNLANSYADYIEEDEGRVVGEHERADMARKHKENAVSAYHHGRANELEPYLVPWSNITANDIMALRQVLKKAKVEEDLQKFLTEKSFFLVQHLWSGHGRYVIPKPKLGAELVPDFLIAEMSSIGLEWYGVELESPVAEMFTSSGQPGHLVTHAIQQVVEWRDWLESNLAYARNPKSEQGLGLVGITSDLPATILMGRRYNGFPSNFNSYRRQIKSRQNIEIHTYDWLAEQAELRVQALQKSGKPNP